VGVGGEVDALAVLARRVRFACELLAPAIARERFVPHLTVARPDGARPRPPLELSPDTPKLGDWPVREVSLVESRISSAGARYTVRERFPLAATEPPGR
jgi:2'-5' RNA ligase